MNNCFKSGDTGDTGETGDIVNVNFPITIYLVLLFSSLKFQPFSNLFFHPYGINCSKKKIN